MNNFLPQDYQAPKSNNNYMKLQEGENKIRILSSPILGWEDWENNKPVRFRMDKKPIKSVDPKKPLRHFWAFIVWNYAQEVIQVLQITQASIRNALEALSKDTDWGAPFFYDVKIIKKGEGKDTEYVVNPLPHKDLDKKIKREFDEKPCWLDVLFDNGDPFSLEWDTCTQGVFSKSDIGKSQPTKEGEFISKDQAVELKKMLDECDPNYKKELQETLKNPQLGVESIDKLPTSMYNRIYSSIAKKRAEFHKMTKSEEVFA